ncbi:MAG: LuxR C-terminal-related transcriptional regulator [Actinomycetota bacterium]
MACAGESEDAVGCGRFAAPQPAAGLALRPEVSARLSAPDMRVGVITAPAGYGKSSHAAAWVAHEQRSAAWLDIEDGHNDALVLLNDLMAALTTVTDFRADGLAVGGATSDQYATSVSTALGRALLRCTVPFVLVLDDVHRLDDPSATDLVNALISNVPTGSTVLLVGRACRLSELNRLRVASTVAEIGTDDLALEPADVAVVLSGMGVDAGVEQVEKVVADTEGWPVGVRLAGLASLADVQHHVPGAWGLSGRETSVFNYIRSEWLRGLSDEDRDFLVRVSVFDWLSGPLCNKVLDRHDAGDVLHRIYGDRLLVIPLDRREHAYRMHGLLRDALEAEFERIDANAVRQAHQRGSIWFEEAGDIDRAVRHAAAAEDFDRAVRLVVGHTPSYYTNGHHTTLKRWIESIPRDRVLRSPGLCLTAALASLGLCEPAALSIWIRLGEQAAASAPGSDPMAWLCLRDLRSTTNTGTVRPALEDAAAAYTGLPPGIWHSASCLAYGVWSWTVDDDIAVKVLAEGAEEAAVLGAPALEAYCTAMIALIAYSEGDSARAASLARDARRVAVENRLEQAPGMAVVSAMCALVAASRGDAQAARTDWHLARAQLARFKDMFGWANVQTRVALAHTSLLLGDRIGTETMLREAKEILVEQPDATRAHRQVAKLEDLVRHLRRHATIGSSSLTTAELRALHYLPTNLTLAEIGTRLYVSRYTVKTHCESIYRKLNVNLRSEAVESARGIGLLGDGTPTDVA